MDRSVTIELKELTLVLRVGGKGGGRHALQAPVGRTAGGAIRRDQAGRITVIPLSGVTFSIRTGERVGLIGRNGAGKSTLLRVMAGIYTPTSGTCQVRGSVSTLFSANLGMNANASGEENIRLVCTLLGIRRREIDALIPEIAEFCELGDFLAMPMRTYSAGMRTRLGFAIATSLRPSILLIDEVFGAGDKWFRQKAEQRFHSMLDDSSTVVMASHSDGLLKQFCDTAIWLERGELVQYGPVDDVAAAYNAAPPGQPRPQPSEPAVVPADGGQGAPARAK